MRRLESNEAELFADRIARLQTLTAALSQTLSVAEVGEVVVAECTASLRASAGALALAANNELQAVHVAGPPPWLLGRSREVPLDAAVPAAEAVRNGEPVVVRGSEVRRRFPGLSGGWAAMPLPAENRFRGNLGSRAVESVRSPATQGVLVLRFPPAVHLDAGQRSFLLGAARQCAQALERARLFEAERGAFDAAEAARREALEAVQIRDKVLSVVSHDLRNPLQAVALGTELLRRSLRPDHPDHAVLTRGLARIAKAARSMTTLVEELVDVAGLQAGRELVLQERPVDLAALVRQVAEDVDAGRGVIRVRAPGELAGRWDPARLERLVANLLHNAVKYSPEGSPVAVRVRRSGEQAEVTVTDRGLGIPAEDLPHVFEWFRRGSNVVGRLPGTGVGLASARRIVGQHGGTITVQSAEGTGSTFTVLLPLGS